MISENFFASHYTSVWKSLTPSMENFVRSQNLDGYERHWIPIESVTEPNRRGLINEAGFLIFKEAVYEKSPEKRSKLEGFLKSAFSASAKYVLGGNCKPEDESYSTVEADEAIELASRIIHFFVHTEKKKEVSVSPQFNGNGIISDCFGDVQAGQSLYEIKSGNRNFRSIDFRQLAVYLALEYASAKEVFDYLSLYNPRTGISLKFPTEEFTFEVSGQTPVTFCQSLIDCFSSNLVSE